MTKYAIDMGYLPDRLTVSAAVWELRHHNGKVHVCWVQDMETS